MAPQTKARGKEQMRSARRYLRDVVNKINNHESLAGVDLRNLYLSYMDFSGLDLRGANFEGCRLSYGNMDGSDLTNATLANADLTNSSFRGANLTGAILKNAIVVGANFEGAKGLSSQTKLYLRSKGGRSL